jgi:hypothetical protein
MIDKIPEAIKKEILNVWPAFSDKTRILFIKGTSIKLSSLNGDAIILTPGIIINPFLSRYSVDYSKERDVLAVRFLEPLQWKKEKPTQKGYYWMHYAITNKTQIIKVDNFNLDNEELLGFAIGTDEWFGLDNKEYTFCGPVIPPILM